MQKFIDRDGLKVLWNQVNLKDYPNNETLIAVIDAIDETKADKETLKNYYLKTEADTLHTEIEDYVDNQVAALVNSAPETLDTLGELAAAFEENKEVYMDALKRAFKPEFINRIDVVCVF